MSFSLFSWVIFSVFFQQFAASLFYPGAISENWRKKWKVGIRVWLCQNKLLFNSTLFQPYFFYRTDRSHFIFTDSHTYGWLKRDPISPPPQSTPTSYYRVTRRTIIMSTSKYNIQYCLFQDKSEGRKNQWIWLPFFLEVIPNRETILCFILPNCLILAQIYRNNNGKTGEQNLESENTRPSPLPCILLQHWTC